MMKKYELEQIIKDALLDLDGRVMDTKLGDGSVTLFEADVEKDPENGDLIFTFKEDAFKPDVDRYRISINFEK